MIWDSVHSSLKSAFVDVMLTLTSALNASQVANCLLLHYHVKAMHSSVST